LTHIKALRRGMAQASGVDAMERSTFMGFLARLNESGTLMEGMADRLGVDLRDGMDTSPEIAAATYRKMMLACAGCSEHAACADLQAQTSHLDEAPAYCRNRERFAAV
jgi:hypothetical protein